MPFTPENIFFMGSVLIFASIVINKWGYRFGVPTLLLFLFTDYSLATSCLPSHSRQRVMRLSVLQAILMYNP